MDVHTPKKVHNWRELAGEIAIIVVGVLIALVAEQVVQALEWRHKAHLAEEAMRYELTVDDGPQAYARALAHRCIIGALDRIRAAVEANAPRAEVRAAIDGYTTPFWTWDALAYDAAVSSDVPLHIASERMAKWTAAYALMPALNAANAREFADAAPLAALARTGGGLTPAERDRVLVAVETLRRDAETIQIAVRVALPAIEATGVRASPAITRRALAPWRARAGAACFAQRPGT